MAVQQVRKTSNFDTDGYLSSRKSIEYNQNAIYVGNIKVFPYMMSSIFTDSKNRWNQVCFNNINADEDYSAVSLANFSDDMKSILMIPKSTQGSVGNTKIYFETNSYDTVYNKTMQNYNGTNTYGYIYANIQNGFGASTGFSESLMANDDSVMCVYVATSDLPTNLTRFYEFSTTYNNNGSVGMTYNQVGNDRLLYIKQKLQDEDYILVSYYYLYKGSQTARTQQSYLKPVCIAEYDGYYVAEVDESGNYTNRLVEQTGKMYVKYPAYTLLDLAVTSNHPTPTRITTPSFEHLTQLSDIFGQDDLFIGYSGTTRPYVYIKRDSFIRYMNYVGLPWTFDSAAAASSPIGDLSDGYDPNQKYYDPSNPPGQPDDTTGGGDGTGDNKSDDYTPSSGYNPLFPTSKQYVLDAQDVDIFQSYLWEPSAWQSIQELWGDAWGAIISLKYYPFSLLQHDSNSLGDKETIKIGKVSLSSIGNISQPAQGMPMLPNYNCRFELGEFKFDEYYGTFMDYEPYTSISIFLPFIGWRDLGVSEVMGKNLKVHYIVDFNTGNCTAYLTIYDGKNEFLYNQYQGTIAVDLPLSKNDFQQKMLSLGVGVMSASLTAAVQASGPKQTTTTSGTGESNVKGVSESRHFSTNLSGKLTGNKSVGDSFSNMARESKSTTETVTKTDPTLGMVNGFSGAMSNFVRPVTSTTTGTVGASDTLWISRKPIIRIERPIKSEASSFEENQGRPANITKKLGDLTGYVECLNPVLNFHCDESERTKISALLQGGIYL